MNNEPVAWMHKDLKDGWLSCTNQHPETEIDDWLPLYTHPAKTTTLVLDGNRVYPTVKELTDEEILEFRDKVPSRLVLI